MNTKHYECAACRFPQSITDEGYDKMREHIKTAHVGDRKLSKDAYVVIKSDPTRWPKS